jgi:PAS domain S-box-containing protein
MLLNRLSPVMIRIIVLIIIITSVFVYSISKETEHALKESIQDKLISLANITASRIDGDSFSRIQSGDENTSSFLEIRDFLQRTKVSAKNATSIYTMRKNGADVEFVVDADYGYIPDTPNIGQIYEVEQIYNKAEPEIIKGFLIPTADEDFTTDQWGTTLSGFSPIRDSNGSVVGIVGIDMNSSDVITELNKLNIVLYFFGFLAVLSSIIGVILIEGRQAESDLLLKESERQYRYLFDNAGDVIFILSVGSDHPGEILAANQLAYEVYGFQSDELVGMNISQLTASENDILVNEWISRIFQGENIHAENSHIKKNGTVFPVDISASLINAGREIYILDIIRDITERKRSDLIIEENEQRLRFALESIEAAEWDLNLKERTIFRSSHYDQLFGYDSDAPEWTYGIFLEHIFSDDRKKVEETIQSSIDTRQKFAIDCRILQRDRTIRWLRISGHPRPDQNGNPDRMVGLCFDITGQKEMEDEIRQSLREKEILLHEIHHRVKNNLQIISSLISMKMRTIPDESVRMQFRETQSRIYLIALVYEHLYKSGNLEMIEYGPFLKRLCSSLYELYSIHHERIIVTIDDGGTQISLKEAVPCTLIIRELLSNSIQHAFPGDQSGEIHISVRIDPVKDEYSVLYQDNGIGLPKDLDLQRVKSIGMQLILGLTKQLGGTIQIECRNGFYAAISFPVIQRNKVH